VHVETDQATHHDLDIALQEKIRFLTDRTPRVTQLDGHRKLVWPPREGIVVAEPENHVGR
jgi:hypothetical protein